MSWLTYTLITTLFYGVFNMFMKLTSGYGINSQFGTFVLNLTASLIMLIYLLFYKFSAVKLENLISFGVIFAIFAGISAAIGNTARFISFDLGAPLAISQLITSIGSLVIVSVLSFIFLKESFTLGKFIGMVIGVFGLYLMIKY